MKGEPCIDFEIEATNVAQARELVDDVQEVFGDDIYITVKLVGEGKHKALSTLDDGMKKIFAQISEKINQK